MTDLSLRQALAGLVADWRELADSADCCAKEAKRLNYAPEGIEKHARTALDLTRCAEELETTLAPHPAAPQGRDDFVKCARCLEMKECLLIETGFAGEHEPLCADCISKERSLAEASPQRSEAVSPEMIIKFDRRTGSTHMTDREAPQPLQTSRESAGERAKLELGTWERDLLDKAASAVCENCREYGWPTNNERGELFHVHEQLEGAPPCKAAAIYNLPEWNTALAQPSKPGE